MGLGLFGKFARGANFAAKNPKSGLSGRFTNTLPQRPME
jgi:hypothetical protein